MVLSKGRLEKVGRIAILLFLAVICWLAGQDILGTVRLSPAVFSGNISRRAVVWVFFIILNAAVLVTCGWANWQKGPFAPDSRFLSFWDFLRSQYRWSRAVLSFLILIVPPLFILYIPNEDVFGQGALRFWVLIAASALFGILITEKPGHLLSLLPFLAGLLAVTVVFKIAVELTQVTNYPFSMGWSEGNRFYDYSLIFGRHLYKSAYPVDLAYYSPGRYGLWGLPFLIDGLPIGIHRLWDGLLWSLVPLLFGWLLLPQASWKWRIGLAMWVAVFIYQGPIYPTLIISAILVSLGFRSQRVGKWIGMAAGGFFAGLSRWTWLAVVGVWGAIIEQLDRPRRTDTIIRRYLPATLVFICGVLSGVLSNLPRLVTPKETSITFAQPLLWYRLFPNYTFPPGILLALFVAAGPLVVFLIWLSTSRRWPIDWTQKVMLLGSGVGFLIAGLVISTKIGGGSNLHNLDMFFLTLVFMLGVGLREQLKEQAVPFHLWPFWIRSWVVLGVLIPAWMIFSQGGPLVLPSMGLAQQYLVDIQQTVDNASTQGEILFIDQRQLLSFHLIKNVDLIPDYEKKYMMDQAMAGNASYFEHFYKDLISHRFSLIITDPLFLVQQGEDYSFGEENDAFVKWVSRPLLCYYEIKDTLGEVRVQYLTPRQGLPPADMECPVSSLAQ